MKTQTTQLRCLSALRVALALALVAGAGAAPAAQDLPAPGDGFAWERVGDFPANAKALAFDSEATLWAPGTFGLCRLDATSGFPGTWVVVYNYSLGDALLPLGPDTLLATRPRTVRSTDGGVSFEQV